MDVLLVEDDPLVREALAGVLRDSGFDIAEVCSAEEALALFEHHPGNLPSVVVADLHLGPGMDGLTLGAEVVRRWPRTGVVYATGHPDAIDGRFLGPRERYAVKPVDPLALLRAVRRVMPGGVLDWTMQAAKRALQSERAQRT